ncbi:DUF4198 domain-containing protein [Klebsiella aerogenes]|uniref:DUF4198 domain-containing protein n=1 Tax=Klebsiella aerogenes TaxID=548 RepID=UPI0037B6C4AB
MAGCTFLTPHKLIKIPRLFLFSLALYSVNVFAHDFWILPHDAMSKSGDRVFFELRIGPGVPGKQTPRLPGLIATFDSTDAMGQRKIEGHDGALVIGHLKTRTAGATLASLTTNGAKITLPAGEFEDYLKEEGLDKIVRARQENGESEQPGIEIFYRCAKSIILVDNQSKGYDRILGLEHELVPLTDPVRYKPGTPYRVRLLANSQPLANLQVKAELNTTPPTILRTTTDDKGIASFNLPVKGEWLFSSVDMDISPVDGADWKSIWASLTLPIAAGDKA